MWNEEKYLSKLINVNFKLINVNFLNCVASNSCNYYNSMEDSANKELTPFLGIIDETFNIIILRSILVFKNVY